MATLRSNVVLSLDGLSMPVRAEVARLLTLTSGVKYVQEFTLTDASAAGTQQKVFYDRSLTDAFQSNDDSGQAGIIIVDPEGVYDDDADETQNIFAQVTVTDTSNANASAQTPFRVRAETPYVFSTLEYCTTLTSGTPNRVLGKLAIQNNNASGDGSVKVLVILFG